MLQPTLVVKEDDHKVVHECTWSWVTMGYGSKDELDEVPTEPWDGPPRRVALVTLRPVVSDLLPSILERRPVKLKSTHENVQDIL
mmetsp:Transcript_757/g.2580  ORF Transcript_757/g.2580 Transcript_757/m.2580 type:complete len:85 (+) Transcript_757:384-638(+)